MRGGLEITLKPGTEDERGLCVILRDPIGYGISCVFEDSEPKEDYLVITKFTYQSSFLGANRGGNRNARVMEYYAPLTVLLLIFKDCTSERIFLVSNLVLL